MNDTMMSPATANSIKTKGNLSKMKTSTLEDIAIAVVSFALAYHAYLIIAALAK
jgi:hypothetical protein